MACCQRMHRRRPEARYRKSVHRTDRRGRLYVVAVHGQPQTYPIFRELLKDGLENASAHDAAVSHRARAWRQPGNGSAVRPPYNGQFSGSFGPWGEAMRLTPISGYGLTARARAAVPGRNRACRRPGT